MNNVDERGNPFRLNCFGPVSLVFDSFLNAKESQQGPREMSDLRKICFDLTSGYDSVLISEIGTCRMHAISFHL